MRTTLVILIVLFTNVNFLIAQEQEEAHHQFYYNITVEASDPAESYSKTLNEQQASDFKVSSFLDAQKADTRIKINGRQINNTSYTTFSFDSNSLDEKGDCNRYCKKYEHIERMPFLGIAVLATDDFSGVEVDYLLEGSPLHQTGIQSGDIITEVDAYEVTNPCELIAAIAEYAVDDPIGLHFFRKKESHFINAKVGYRLKKQVSWTTCCEPLAESKKAMAKDQIALNVFPNPSSGLIQFKFRTSSTAETAIRLSDFNGRIIHTKKVMPLNGIWSDYFDLSSFGPGVYSLQIEQQEQVVTERVVVVKD